MKRLHHILAVIAGFLLSAVIVLVVFGLADRDGSAPEGQAPGEATRRGAPAHCAAREGLLDDRGLPPIYDHAQRQVVPSKPSQVRWFARVHSALGGCTEEIVVHAKKVTVTAGFIGEIEEATLRSYAYGFLVQAFSDPLRRSFAQLEVFVGDSKRTVFVSAQAWGSIRANGRYSRTIGGLAQAKRGIGYGDAELRLAGW